MQSLKTDLRKIFSMLMINIEKIFCYSLGIRTWERPTNIIKNCKWLKLKDFTTPTRPRRTGDLSPSTSCGLERERSPVRRGLSGGIESVSSLHLQFLIGSGPGGVSEFSIYLFILFIISLVCLGLVPMCDTTVVSKILQVVCLDRVCGVLWSYVIEWSLSEILLALFFSIVVISVAIFKHVKYVLVGLFSAGLVLSPLRCISPALYPILTRSHQSSSGSENLSFSIFCFPLRIKKLCEISTSFLLFFRRLAIQLKKGFYVY